MKSNEQDIIEEIQQAAAWAKGPYGPAPPGWERSDAPFRAKDEIAFLRNQLAQWPWQPIGTAPKSGEFLIGVWEGSWDNPKQGFRVYHAHGTKYGPSWAMRDNYREAEGGAYELAGWMPLPPPPTPTIG